MSKPTNQLPADIPIRVYAIPAEDRVAWDSVDDRVSCSSCANKRGWKCEVSGDTHVPLFLKHRCNTYQRRK